VDYRKRKRARGKIEIIIIILVMLSIFVVCSFGLLAFTFGMPEISEELINCVLEKGMQLDIQDEIFINGQALMDAGGKYPEFLERVIPTAKISCPECVDYCVDSISYWDYYNPRHLVELLLSADK